MTHYKNFAVAIKSEFGFKMNANEKMHGVVINDDGSLFAMNVKNQAVNAGKIINMQSFSDDYSTYTVHIAPSHFDKYLHEVQNGVYLFASGMQVKTSKIKTWNSVAPSGKIIKHSKSVPHTLDDQTIPVGFFTLTDHMEILDDGSVELILKHSPWLEDSIAIDKYKKYMEANNSN